MRKKLFSAFLVFALILCLIPSMAFADSHKVELTVEPSNLTPENGSEVTFTVSVQTFNGGSISSIQLGIDVPTGLTYVAGSGKVDAGFKEATGAENFEWLEVDKEFFCSSSAIEGLNGLNEKKVIGTFKCTVDAEASGNVQVGLTIVDLCDKDLSTISGTDLKNDKVTITITAAPKPATGITLNKNTLELTVGESETLVATVEPADTTDTVTWESGNIAVATVDTNGKVTAVAPGTASITAEAGSQHFDCVVTVKNAPCIHTTKTNVGEKASTCIEKGWDAYSKCNDCGQLFDKDGNEIDAIPYRSLADHNYGTLIKQVDAVHTSTELKAGTKAHYECSVCHKLFDEGENEVTAEDLVIPAPAHSYADTWSKDGTNHWKECDCGAKKDIAAHSFEWVVDKAATEEETGLKHEECVCGETRNLNTVIDKLDHTHNWVETKAKASTCKEQGNNQYFYCTKCEKYYKADKVTETTVAAEMLTLAAHTATPHAAVEATCTKEGNIAYWTCSVCEKYFSDEACTTEITKADTVVSKKSHSYDESKWVSDSSKHWHACSVCGDKKDEAAHTYGSDNKCTECGYAKPTYIGGIAIIQKPVIEGDAGAAWTLSSDGTKLTISAKEGYTLADVTLNGVSKGQAAELTGLKTGDKVVIRTVNDADVLAEKLAAVKLVARSKMSAANGKAAVKVYWFAEDGSDINFDGYEIFRSTKRYSGYGKTPFFETGRETYWNTAIKGGNTYYYKVRGYIELNGERYYTEWSKKAWRTVK